MTIDGYYPVDKLKELYYAVNVLPFVQKDIGQEIENFNLVGEDASEIFSKVLSIEVEVIDERSGVFRRPELFIHFEEFDALNEWVFVVAIDDTTFNIFEHKSGSENALQGYKYAYRNLFDWNLTVNYQLKAGQGVFFRPWLFHSFSSGLIQVFRLREKNGV
jgi:hypothetical protein